MQNVKLLNYLHLHFIVFIWGFTAVLGALISLPSVSLVWWRMSIAVVFITLYLWIKKIDWFPRQALRQPDYKKLGILLVAGVIIALHWVTFFAAIKVSNVSVTLAMISTGAFFTALMEPLFMKRKIILYELLFGFIIVLALIYIFQVETQYLSGMLLGISSAILSALFSIINGTLAKAYRPSLISFWELLGGIVVLSLLLLLPDISVFEKLGLSLQDFWGFQGNDWFWLLILAIICTSYAFIASVKVMRYISPYTVMLTINLEPVYGILLAYLVFGDAEAMTPEFYYGAAIIIVTVIANGILKVRRKEKVIPA
ncbi:MAG: DMT family transporter [Flavobacteriaceae bacterium]|nr:DMT family transporter [Flavobacteriaceae bacterium]